MIVDFMIIGAQKCGTTSLSGQLSNHPEICFSKVKEPGYFQDVDNWQENLGSYHRLFAPMNGQLLGEASTMYTFLPEFTGTHSRLYEYNPHLKLIYIMRHPVERVISHYTHRLLRNQVKAGPETAVFNDPSYINRSRYGVQIKPYIEQFGRENIHLIIFEEYVADQIAILNQVARFLNIDESPFSVVDQEPKHKSVGNDYLKYASLRKIANADSFKALQEYIPVSWRKAIRRRLSNKIDWKPEFSHSLRKLIWQFVEDDVGYIEQLLQRRITVWRERNIL